MLYVLYAIVKPHHEEDIFVITRGWAETKVLITKIPTSAGGF